MKSLLCVLLTMIISLGSMVTVKADTEIKPYENKENAVLLKREYIDLDEDTVIEIESYEEKIPSLARAGWKNTSAIKTYRVKDKKVKNKTGFGLGLAFAKKVVNAYGGEIRVESAPGKGSRFEVRIKAE